MCSQPQSIRPLTQELYEAHIKLDSVQLDAENGFQDQQIL